jgi:hypothetical protein
MVAHHRSNARLNIDRLLSGFALSLLLAAGCGERRGANQAGSCKAGTPDAGDSVAQGGSGSPIPGVVGTGGTGGKGAGADGGPQQTGKNTLQFGLSEGQYVDISLTTPGIALAVIVIRDQSGHALRTVKATNSPAVGRPGNGMDAMGFVWDGRDDDGRPQATGIYTAEIAATDGEPLRVDCVLTPAAATGNVTLRGNLDPSARPVTFDPGNANATSSFNTSIVVYDALGGAIQLNIYFSKNDPASSQPGDLGSWAYHVVTDGANLDTQADGTPPAMAGKPTEVASGTLRFGTCGVLISNVTTFNAFNPKGAVSPQPLTFNFGTGTAAGGAGVDGMTQSRANSSVSFVSQDGNCAFIACVATDAQSDAGPDGQTCADTMPSPVAATTGITIRGNLDETAAPTVFDPDNLQTTSNFSAGMTAHDSFGRPIEIDISFCKNDSASTEAGDSGDWTYHVITAPQNLAAAGAGTSPGPGCGPAEIATGTLRFDSAGRLISHVTSATATFVPQGATVSQTIILNFGSGTASGGSGLDGLTQYAATSAISFLDEQSI